MRQFMRGRASLLMIVLSLIGVGISIYLTSVHYENVPLVCSNTGLIDCSRVLSSVYSTVPGTTVPISVPGLAWCLVAGALAFSVWKFGSDYSWPRVAQLVWTVVGIATVLYLVFVEIVKLHTICAWCTGLHVIILIMLIVALLQLQNGEDDLDYADEEEDDAAITSRSQDRAPVKPE